MGHTGVTLVPTTGKEIPKDFAELVLKHENTTMGFATVHEGTLLVEPMEATTTPDSLAEMVKSLAGGPLALCFQHMDKVSPESRQPFVGLEDEEGRKLLAVFLSGDFTKYEEKESAHSGAFFAFVKYLRPRINKLFRLCGNDLDKFFDELDDKLTKDDLANVWGDFGAITFVGANGKILTLEDNEHRFVADWGYASKSFGYADAKPVMEKEPEKKLSMAEQIKAKLAGAKPAEAKKPAEEKKPEPVLANGGATALTGQNRVTMTKKTLKVPAHLSQSARKKWFRQLDELGGALPDNWKNMSEVVVEVPVTLADLGEAAKQQAAKGSVPTVAATKDADKPVADKAVEPVHVGKKEPVAVIEPLAMNKLREILKRATFQKAKDYNSQAMLDPKLIAGLEAQIGPIWSQIPDDNIESIEDTFHWPLEAYIQIGQGDIRTLALIAFQSRIDYQKLFASETKEEKTPVTIAKPSKQRIAM